jgi:cytoskeletal protein RodZ
MSQGLRDMLADRRFAIPLIGLLALCFIGLLLLGLTFIFGLGGKEPVASVTDTPTPAVTDTSEPTRTPSPTSSPTPSPSPTLVPVGTAPSGQTAQPTGEGTPPTGETVTVEASVTSGTGQGTAVATSEATATQATATPESGEDELAETGVGWSLVFFSGLGLAMLALVARRLRLAD